MRLFRIALVGLCVAAAGLVVPAGLANATPTTLQPPTLRKLFFDSTIPLNGTTGFFLGVANPNATTSLTGVNVSDTMPAGLVITFPFTDNNFCGGSLVVTANSISMTGLTVPPNLSCNVGGSVQGTTLGPKVNTTSAVTSSNGGTGSPATATVLVAHQPPTLTKAFAPSPISVGATTTLTFTLTNPNPTIPLTRITFADPFPPGLGVAANPAVTNTCGGVPSVGPFALAVAYANATIPAGGSCTFSVKVTATSPGVKNNTTTIISSSAGIGSPASASMTVFP